MIFTNFHMEPRSDSPSPMQNMVNVYTTLWNSGWFLLDMMSPFHVAMAALRINRNMAKVFTKP
jgi:hypothetical protein